MNCIVRLFVVLLLAALGFGATHSTPAHASGSGSAANLYVNFDNCCQPQNHDPLDYYYSAYTTDGLYHWNVTHLCGASLPYCRKYTYVVSFTTPTPGETFVIDMEAYAGQSPRFFDEEVVATPGIDSCHLYYPLYQNDYCVPYLN